MKIHLLTPLLITSASLCAQSRQDFAVFFPVTTYSDGWTQLPNTLSECNDLASDLSTLYDFKTEVLPNKTKLEIKTKLAELAQRTYGPDDQLLLFFSMHGFFDEAGEAGCLCPAGAKAEDPAFESWLLHTELRILATRIPCEHILIVLDACYSGTFSGKKGLPDEPDYLQEMPDCKTNIQHALSRNTRYYIASGARQRTPAVSELVKKLRSALGGRYNGNDGVLSLRELLAVISRAYPTPKDGEFAGDLGGSFVFVPRNGCVDAPYPNDPDQSAWNYANAQNTEEAYQFYLNTWAAGRYRFEAQKALGRLQEERVWQAAVQNGTSTAYNSYKAAYCPGGLYCDEAEKKIKMAAVPPAPSDKPAVQTGKSPAPAPSSPAQYTDPLVGVLVLVQGGEFNMGCTDEQNDCESDELPVHRVVLNDYYIGQTEVTQAQWRAVMNDDFQNLAFKDCDNCPVENVSWDDVQYFIAKLNSRRTGARYRLPTEAEWEFAARGGNLSQKYLFSGGSSIEDVGWCWRNAKNKTHTVKDKKPNELGLFDLSGNVWEWCADWYDADYYKNSPVDNPTGPVEGTYRVRRGGSWYEFRRSCRVSDRGNVSPGNGYVNTGFRLARTK